MKKINIFKIIFLISLGITFNYSCTDLEEINYDQILEDKVFQTEADLGQLIAPAYSGLRRSFFEWHSRWMMVQYCTDEMVQPTRSQSAWFDGGVFIAMHKHTWTDELGVSGFWGWVTDAIADINYIIEVLTVSELDIPEELIAEMKIIRALNYYHFTDCFGNIPFVTGFSELPEGYLPPQKNREEVISFLIEEIETNIPLMPDKAPFDNYWGRMTKWGAFGLLAQIYLNHEVYTGIPKWDKCIAACDSIINSDHFILEDDYSAPFAAKNEGCQEHVFTLPFDETNAGWLGLHQLTLSASSKATYNAGSNLWNGIQAVPSFFDSYDTDDIRRDKTWITGVQYDIDGDTIFVDGAPLEYINHIESINLTDDFDGARFGKFEFYEGMLGSLNNDVPLIRYADILMMKAECLLRKGDKTEAVALINQVRKRAFEPDKPVTESELDLDRMLAERGWEFAGEGCRRQDQIRFGRFTTTTWDPNHDIPSGEHCKIFPIPQDALDANPNLKQNPGYNEE